MSFNLTIILLINLSLILGQSNPDLRTYSTNYRAHHTYQRLPTCAISQENGARFCARDRSGVTVADQHIPRRVCCYEWVLIDCWDELNRRHCTTAGHYQDWLQFREYSIKSVEQVECRDHRYQPGLNNCHRWKPYRPAEADTEKFTDNKDNNKSASYLILSNLFFVISILIFRILSI